GLIRCWNSTSGVTVRINRMTELSYFRKRNTHTIPVHLNPLGLHRLKSTMGSTRKLIGQVRCLRVKGSTPVVRSYSGIGKVPVQKFEKLCIRLKKDNGNGMTKRHYQVRSI